MRRILFLALLTSTWLLPRDASADVVLPITPDPADCVADPIDIETLVALASGFATPVALAVQTPLAGTPTSELLDRLTEVVVASTACTNANQPLRALSYFTEDYLLDRISDEPAITLGHLQAAASRHPDVAAVEDRVTITSLSAGPTGDGAAFLEVGTLAGTEAQVVSLRLIVEDTVWRIDQVSEAIID